MLLVGIPGEERRYVADVGFGSVGGLLEAVPLVADTEFHDGTRRHRYVREPYPEGLEDLWVFQAFLDGSWQDQYAFTREPFEASDYGIVNCWRLTAHRHVLAHMSECSGCGTCGPLSENEGSLVECVTFARGGR